MFFTFDEIVEATSGNVISAGSRSNVVFICLDSRKIKEGNTFFALKGSNFDGHDFIREAVARGAAHVIINGEQSENIVKMIHALPFTNSTSVITVKDTLFALGETAKYYLKKRTGIVIAVTGSVGKTETKNMLIHILSRFGSVAGTEGNFNNFVGLPLSVFTTPLDSAFIILEMGMSGAGEIARLSEMTNPDAGVITTVGPAHLESLLTVENVAHAKGELFRALRRDAWAIVNMDHPLILSEADGISAGKKTFGSGTDNDLRIISSGMDEEGKACGVIEINGRQHEILLNLYGKHHIQNASSALCSLLPFDIDIGRAVEDLKNFRGMSNRSNVSRFRNFILINDCYNASPLSMKAAVDLLKSIKSAGRKIACIGDMAELGEFSEKAHREIGNLIAENHIDFLFAVGKEAEKYAEGAVESGMKKDNIFSFSDITEIKEIFNKLVQDDDVILLKGSRIKKMERLLDILME